VQRIAGAGAHACAGIGASCAFMQPVMRRQPGVRRICAFAINQHTSVCGDCSCRTRSLATWGPEQFANPKCPCSGIRGIVRARLVTPTPAPRRFTELPESSVTSRTWVPLAAGVGIQRLALMIVRAVVYVPLYWYPKVSPPNEHERCFSKS